MPPRIALRKGLSVASVHRLLGPEIGEERRVGDRLHRIYERLTDDGLATCDVWFRGGVLTRWTGEVELVASRPPARRRPRRRTPRS